MVSKEDLEFASKAFVEINGGVPTELSQRVLNILAHTICEARRRGREESLKTHQPCKYCGSRWYIDRDGMWTTDHRRQCRTQKRDNLATFINKTAREVDAWPSWMKGKADPT